MDEPGNNSSPGSADSLERLLTCSARGSTTYARSSATSRLAGTATLSGSARRRSGALHDLARELGLVTREEWDELELRVAQLEHRLRLLEEHPTVRSPCYRGSHGMRMGRIPVRSRFLLRTRDLDVRRS